MRAGFVLIVAVCALMLGIASDISAGEKGNKNVASALSFTMDSLDGKPVDLSRYQGKVVLMVNVASKCGLTPQYKQLEALHEKYGKDGLVILGFPANNFGHQEPGTNEEIGSFCRSKYDVKFDMFSKVSVKGDDQCPLYKYLTSKETTLYKAKEVKPNFTGPISWNFEKFLVNSKGDVVARFDPRLKPDDPKVIKAIEGELARAKSSGQ
jgi:glutathione peroxidase